jgi:hypothetical protein
MSRAAQAVAKAVEEMAARRRLQQKPSKRRTAMEQEETKPEAVEATSDPAIVDEPTTEPTPEPQPSEAKTEGDTQMASAKKSTKKKAAKKAAKKAKAPKAPRKRGLDIRPRKAAKVNGVAFEGIPKIEEMRLAGREGVRSENEHDLVLSFTNGFELRLQPIGADRAKLRAVTVGWLRRRLGADRADKARK